MGEGNKGEVLRTLARSLREHLLWQRELGREGFVPGVAPQSSHPRAERVADRDPGDAPAQAPRDGEAPEVTLPRIVEELGDCQRCRLAKGRRHLVFGVGSAAADLMFIGEAPGRDEDRLGEPFVGKAGKLLDRIIGAIDLAREDVYIANVIKCRPPNNRNPVDDEIEACSPFLMRQIQAVRPRVIVALGRFAMRFLLHDAPISRMRGRFHDFDGIPIMPTYHPAYLLRNPDAKRLVWDDMKKVRDLLRDERSAVAP